MKVVQDMLTSIGTMLLVLGGVFLLSILLALPIKWVWNWVMVDIFNLPIITVMQAWGLSILSGLMLKSTVTHKK
jgi:hypothetical protein